MMIVPSSCPLTFLFVWLFGCLFVCLFDVSFMFFFLLQIFHENGNSLKKATKYLVSKNFMNDSPQEIATFLRYVTDWATDKLCLID